jgi:LemA protein
VQFNERVEAFNSAIRRLPGSLVADFGGFRRKAYFQAEQGAAEAAELGF